MTETTPLNDIIAARIAEQGRITFADTRHVPVSRR
jgi:hypothetical protein